MNSELIELIYSLVTVEVESGVDINVDNFSRDVRDNIGSSKLMKKKTRTERQIIANEKSGHPNCVESVQAF